MRIERTIQVDAPPALVWSVLSDIERWPEWTASVRSIERQSGAQFAPGLVVTIKQPRLPRARWTVTSVHEGESFDWESRAVGLSSVATHSIAPAGEASVVTLSIEQHGFAEPFVRVVYGGLTRRYVNMEAEGLKRRAESLAWPASAALEGTLEEWSAPAADEDAYRDL